MPIADTLPLSGTVIKMSSGNCNGLWEIKPHPLRTTDLQQGHSYEGLEHSTAMCSREERPQKMGRKYPPGGRMAGILKKWKPEKTPSSEGDGLCSEKS